MAVCALCLQERQLRDSHIIPKFVFDYLKRTSATGFLRFSDRPNRRAQDGMTAALLCDECEQRLSVFEKYFAEHQGYQTNRYPSLSEQTRAEIGRRWGPVITKYGYDPAAARTARG